MEALYLKEAYLKEFDSAVEDVDGKYVRLKETAFYPSSGGQPSDRGTLIGKEEYEVVDVGKVDEKIVHELSRAGLRVGDRIHGIIDWGRRHRLMRMHTASHLLSAIINTETGALITGNQLGIDRSRIDFNLEKFDRDKFYKFCEKANEYIERDLPVTTYSLSRERALALPSLTKLAKGLPTLEQVRIVEIQCVDLQADGGTHVKSLNEIGKIQIVKLENKGKNNRRIYFTIP